MKAKGPKAKGQKFKFYDFFSNLGLFANNCSDINKWELEFLTGETLVGEVDFAKANLFSDGPARRLGYGYQRESVEVKSKRYKHSSL